MPSSVLFWNRLEPRPQTSDLSGALRCEVRDALWMLARQWQMGEFRAEDAGACRRGGPTGRRLPGWLARKCTRVRLAPPDCASIRRRARESRSSTTDRSGRANWSDSDIAGVVFNLPARAAGPCERRHRAAPSGVVCPSRWQSPQLQHAGAPVSLARVVSTPICRKDARGM
jgi:hypothetical protein